MLYADQLGLFNVARRMREFSRRTPSGRRGLLDAGAAAGAARGAKAKTFND